MSALSPWPGTQSGAQVVWPAWRMEGAELRNHRGSGSLSVSVHVCVCKCVWSQVTERTPCIAALWSPWTKPSPSGAHVLQTGHRGEQTTGWRPSPETTPSSVGCFSQRGKRQPSSPQEGPSCPPSYWTMHISVSCRCQDTSGPGVSAMALLLRGPPARGRGIRARQAWLNQSSPCKMGPWLS